MRMLRQYCLGLALGAATLFAGCADQEEGSTDSSSADPSLEQGVRDLASSKSADCKTPGGTKHRQRFAVFSDPHLYDTALGTEGAAFDAYMAADRKMLVQSEAILSEVVERIIQERPNYVLIPGDLTKDGERVDHQRFARYLKKIERAGIDVFVIPGNHDVMNPDAVRYTPKGSVRVANVSEWEFASIYREFGYSEAIDRDENSLSYVAEPAPGTWLLAIDSTRHRENTAASGPVTAGRLSAGTHAWVLQKLKQAKRKGKHVIGMMHHGLLEHYTGQTLIFPEYVIENHTSLSKELADAGMRVVFTGHFHANDVTSRHWDNGANLTDVETGSLVTAPSPYRFVDYYPIEDQMIVTTEHVTDLPGYVDFGAWAAKFLDDGLKSMIFTQLTGAKLADAATAQVIAPVIASALEAHYAGDEPPADAMTQQIAGLLTASGTAAGQAWGYSLLSLHSDLAPSDNDVILYLSGSPVPHQ